MFRRSITLLFVLILSGAAVVAQDAPASDPSTSSNATESHGAAWGARLFVGPSIAVGADATTTSGQPEYDGGTSLGAGLFALWGSRSFLDFGLQLELQYVAENIAYVESQTGQGTSNVPYDFSRLRLPVIGKLSLGAPLALQPSVYLGGYAQYLLSASMNEQSIESESLDPFGYGLTMGVDLRFLQILMVDVRYNYGLSNDIKDDPLDTRIHSLTVGAAIIF